MKNKDEILQTLRTLLVEHFELPEQSVVPEARLYEDLEIDSIDAVDLLAELKRLTGQKLEPQAFKKIRTVGDVVDALDEMLNSSAHAAG